MPRYNIDDILQKLTKNHGWIFQKSVQLMPRKLKFRKNTGWVFQKSVYVIPRKTEISETFLDEFSRICQKGLRESVTVLSCTYSGPFVVVRSWFVRSRDLLNTDFGKYFLFIYLINGSNSLTFLSSKLLTLRFITLLLTVSNNTKYQFHIFFFGNVFG